MRLRELVGRRVSAAASATSLQPLSAQEVQKVAGGIYYSPDGHGDQGPLPGFPGPGGAGPLFPEPLPTPMPDPFMR